MQQYAQSDCCHQNSRPPAMHLQLTASQLSEYIEECTHDGHMIWIDPRKCRHENTIDLPSVCCQPPQWSTAASWHSETFPAHSLPRHQRWQPTIDRTLCLQAETILFSSAVSYAPTHPCGVSTILLLLQWFQVVNQHASRGREGRGGACS